MNPVITLLINIDINQFKPESKGIPCRRLAAKKHTHLTRNIDFSSFRKHNLHEISLKYDLKIYKRKLIALVCMGFT